MTRRAVAGIPLIVACLSLLGAAGGAQTRPAPGTDNTAIGAGDDGAPAVAARDLPELKCRLSTREPVLDYEFRFYAPFWVNIPARRLYGAGRRLSSTAVIQPVSVEGAEPVRVQDRYVLGKEVPEGTRGEVELGGAFALGEGRYQVDWTVKDEAGRSCHVSWKLEAKLPRRQRHVNLSIEPGEVAPARTYLFRPERTVRGVGAGLRVKLLMNLDVPSRRRARVQMWRYVPMISGLRMMSRHRDLSEFALVAFSLEQQEVLYRQEMTQRIRFPALGRAIGSLTPATVELRTLRKGSDLEFLDDLLADELHDVEQVDAIIFVGADNRFGKQVTAETLGQIREKRVPVFHFNSTPFLWRGAIGNTVRSLGGREYKVRQPHELARAVEELVADILARRPGLSQVGR